MDNAATVAVCLMDPGLEDTWQRVATINIVASPVVGLGIQIASMGLEFIRKETSERLPPLVHISDRRKVDG